MTRATYRELFPDDEEDLSSCGDRLSTGRPCARDLYGQSSLGTAAGATNRRGGINCPDEQSPRGSSGEMKVEIGTPYPHCATRRSTPFGVGRKANLQAPSLLESCASSTMGPLSGPPEIPADKADFDQRRAHKHASHLNQIKQTAIPSPRAAASSPGHPAIASSHDRVISDHPLLNSNGQPLPSDHELDELLRVLSSEGEQRPLFDLDSSIVFSHEEQPGPSTGSEDHSAEGNREGGLSASIGTFPPQAARLPQAISTDLHQYQFLAEQASPGCSPPALVAKPRVDDPLAMLIQLTLSIQRLNGEVNNLVSANTRI